MWALETCTAAETQPLPTKKTDVCLLFVNSLHLYHSRGGCNRHTGILAGAVDMEPGPWLLQEGQTKHQVTKKIKRTAGEGTSECATVSERRGWQGPCANCTSLSPHVDTGQKVTRVSKVTRLVSVTTQHTILSFFLFKSLIVTYWEWGRGYVNATVHA